MLENAVSSTRITKHPDETIIYNISFTDRLTEGTSISSINSVDTLTLSGVSALDLETSGEVIDGDVVKFFVSGGTNYKSYRLEANVETSDDQTLIQAGMLEVLK